MKPLLTALIDTFNHEKYIDQALTSVLEQGFSAAELEIVVVDDGSTDNTPAIIQKFAPRVKHLRKKNGGQASAFNSGFAETHGEIVATLDGDDWWAKGKLAKVVEALERNPEVAAVGHGYYEVNDETREERLRVPRTQAVVNLATPDAVHKAIEVWGFMLPGALTLRRRVLEWIMPIPEEMVFMADTALQAAAMFMGTLVLEDPLYYYRHHAQNLYALDPANLEKMRRRYAMAEITYGGMYRRLIQLGVREDTVSALVGGQWLEAKRWRLGTFGGSRRDAFETEMQAFHMAFKNPSMGYRLFKYSVVAAATWMLPARWFYGIRSWYAKRELGTFRNRLLREDTTGPFR